MKDLSRWCRNFDWGPKMFIGTALHDRKLGRKMGV
jgi:hypothetical protein